MALGVKTNYGTYIKYPKILKSHPAKILKNLTSNQIMGIIILDNPNMDNNNFNIMMKVIQYNLSAKLL